MNLLNVVAASNGPEVTPVVLETVLTDNSDIPQTDIPGNRAAIWAAIRIENTADMPSYVFSDGTPNTGNTTDTGPQGTFTASQTGTTARIFAGSSAEDSVTNSAPTWDGGDQTNIAGIQILLSNTDGTRPDPVGNEWGLSATGDIAIFSSYSVAARTVPSLFVLVQLVGRPSTYTSCPQDTNLTNIPGWSFHSTGLITPNSHDYRYYVHTTQKREQALKIQYLDDDYFSVYCIYEVKG